MECKRECTCVHTCKAHINLKLKTNYTYRIEYQRQALLGCRYASVPLEEIKEQWSLGDLHRVKILTKDAVKGSPGTKENVNKNKITSPSPNKWENSVDGVQFRLLGHQVWWGHQSLGGGCMGQFYGRNSFTNLQTLGVTGRCDACCMSRSQLCAWRRMKLRTGRHSETQTAPHGPQLPSIHRASSRDMGTCLDA